jgi:hypothetical protein
MRERRIRRPGEEPALLDLIAKLREIVVQQHGNSSENETSFLGLAGIASIGLVFFALFMPETKDQGIRENATPSPTAAPAPV